MGIEKDPQLNIPLAPWQVLEKRASEEVLPVSHVMLPCSRIHCSSGGILQLLTAYVFEGKNFYDDENILSYHIIDIFLKKKVS